MTLKELIHKVFITKLGDNNYKVAVKFRNKIYVFPISDTEVYDRIYNIDIENNASENGLTLKQAYKRLYDIFILNKIRGDFK